MTEVRGRRRPTGTTVRRLLALGVAATLLALTAPPAATSQDLGTTRVRLHVTELTGVLGPGTIPPPEGDTLDPEDDPEPPTTLSFRALVENEGDTTLDAGRLVVEVYPAVGSRGELQAAMEGDLPTDPVLVDDPAVRDDALRPGELAGIARSYEQEEIPWAEEGGIHPVRLAVIRGTEVLDEALTAIVWLADHPADPVRTSFVWPLDERPWRSVDGAYPIGIGHSIHAGQRLDTLVRTLERQPSAPVLLAPAAHLLEDLRDRADGFTLEERLDPETVEHRQVIPEATEARRANDLLRRLRDVAAELPYAPVTSTYAGADLSALHATGDRGAHDLASDVAATSRLRLQVELGRPPDGATHLLGGSVSAPVLDLLPGDQLLVPHEAVLPTDTAGPDEPLRVLRSPSGRTLQAFVADPVLSDLVTDPSHRAGPRIGVQRVLAETAMIHLDPTAARPLLLLPEPGWDPGREALSLLLESLTTAPWLALGDVSSALASPRRIGSSGELIEPPTGTFPASFEVELRTAIAELSAARASLPDEATTVDGRTPAELEDALIRSTSRWLRSDTQRVAHGLVADVRDAIATLFGEVTISESSVTLTSDSGQVPVTVQRTHGPPILVRIEVASQGRLIWPEGRHSETLQLDEGSSVTVAFPTEALSTGTLPVTVIATDPSGEHELARTTLTVRSTAIAGPALAGISALVLVLLLIGALRRRRPPPELTVVATPVGRDGGRDGAPDTRY